MADAPRDVWITGIGIVSCLGEGPEAHWRGLNEPTPIVDVKTFAPYAVHPLCRVDFDKQIPKKGDQRQMEPWQRIGTYAAGLALDSAGAKGNSDLLGRMDMIVAAGGGERDWAADGAILTGLPKANDPERFLNERLMSDLRPTLFLAQLSNLLAGNISIVHGVTGSSRTFMGEEIAGVDAVRIALQRIRANQSDIALVGGAQNGERKDLLMLYDFGGFGLKGDFHPVWARASAPGFALASIGAFLVLESRDHAEKRNASPLAKLSQITVASAARQPGTVEASLEKMWSSLGSADSVVFNRQMQAVSRRVRAYLHGGRLCVFGCVRERLGDDVVHGNLDRLRQAIRPHVQIDRHGGSVSQRLQRRAKSVFEARGVNPPGIVAKRIDRTF